MTPITPYLLRAYHEWILDNNCTPYIVVDSFQKDVQVPAGFVQPDGQITLNISPQATGNLCLGEQAIEFNARFSGQVHHLYVPCSAVLAIFAKETGQGTAFSVAPATPEQDESDEPNAAPEASDESLSAESKEQAPETQKEKKRGSHLTVVK